MGFSGEDEIANGKFTLLKRLEKKLRGAIARGATAKDGRKGDGMESEEWLS